MDRETALRKIQKLFALGHNAGATAAEAERALAQAEAMMRAHGISAAEAGTQGAATPTFDWGQDFVRYGDVGKPTKSNPTWFQFLAVGVAQFTDVVVRNQFRREDGYGVGFYGERVDVIFAVYLTDYLKKSTWREAAASGLHAGREREEFRRAMVLRLCERMRSLRAERDVAYAAAGAGTALVVVSQKLVARDEHFGPQEYGEREEVRFTSGAAVAAGRAAADRCGLGRPVGVSSARPALQ